MAIFQKRAFSSSKRKRKEIPEGLWEKCPTCDEIIHQVVLSSNLQGELEGETVLELPGVSADAA